MYEQTPPPGGVLRRVPRAGWRRVGANVWALGITSFATDVSSEMITSVLPVYVVLHLHMTPMTFGAVDGVYQAAAAAVRLASGAVADRWRRHKAVASAGYGLSAIAKLGYLGAVAWPVFLAVISLDRLGKGIRTAPRDALIAATAARGETATAFGVHRAMDAAGTAVGPLVTFLLLTLVPGRFDQVFLVSFACAAVGVVAIALLVESPAPASAPTTRRPLLALAREALAASGFRHVALAAVAVSLATVSDSLIYLVLQRQAAFDAATLTLLFVGTPVAYFVLAGPFGVLADRHGASRMFVAGHVALGLVYAVLLREATSMAWVIGALLLLGAYYAATDGVLAAIASRALPAGVRATGLGLLATGTSAARGAAALAFGALWTWTSTSVALAAFASALAVGLTMAAVLLARMPAPDRASPGSPA